jgi:protein-tyrosine phosphatase
VNGQDADLLEDCRYSSSVTTRVLFVCLGNICRSPTAEGVVRATAARQFPALHLQVDSAGTANYHIGEPADRRTLSAARRKGYEIAAHRARQVIARDFAEFDHILAMDAANLAQLNRQAPARTRARLGLFLQFAPDSGTDEVPDPYYGTPEDFDRVVELCEAGAAGLLRHLSGA